MKTDYDILIVGGGLIGQLTALACAKLGNVSVALVDSRDILKPETLSQDGRAFALSPSSLRLLGHLKIDVSEVSHPIHNMLITDGAIGEEPAWRLRFDSALKAASETELGLAAMVESRLLALAVLKQLKSENSISVLAPHFISGLNHDVSGVSGSVAGNIITAKLLIAADGAGSPIREAAGITCDGHAYKQKALVTTISHSLPHDGLALQRFLPGGPLAVLPLIKQRSQIVWSDKPRAIEAACALSESDFILELRRRIGDHLGEISLEAPRQNYPLNLKLAQNVIGPRLVLVGDAAHVIHPMAGQGLNLGLRDVAALYDILKGAQQTGRDIGGAVLGEYASWRKPDVMALAAATDALSYIYATAKGPLSRPTSKLIGHIRRAGLSAVDDFEALKVIIFNEAVGDAGEPPSLLL